MISNQTGSGGDEDAKADDEGGEEDEAESSEMSAGQKIIAANRKARLQKEKNASENSASGSGKLGGPVHAWCDRVGQQGMRKDKSGGLKGCSGRTLDVLRTIDHSQLPNNVDLVVALVRYIAGQPKKPAEDSGGGAASHPHPTLTSLPPNPLRTLTSSSPHHHPILTFSLSQVLVFLPGTAEINGMLRAMQSDRELGRKERFLLLPLHSELSTSEQKQVFRHPPNGVTKVVLSTNIAEASVTIDDISFVVDCGTHKEMQYDRAHSLSL